jgi:hypothetical protein
LDISASSAAASGWPLISWGQKLPPRQLGVADDMLDPDGVAVLSYEQAKKAAVAKFRNGIWRIEPRWMASVA